MHPGAFGALVVFLMAAGATAAADTAGTGWSPAAGCAVAGFTHKAKQLPLATGGGVTLHSLAGPSTELSDAGQPDSLAATAAACRANPSCVLFTSDGFLIGAYRSAASAAEAAAAIAAEQQRGWPLQWMAMDYAAGACSGTWVADGLEAQLLTMPAQGSWQNASGGQLPKDKNPGNYSQGHEAMVQFCSPAGAALAAQNTQCTPRCRVACCARFAAGIKKWDRGLYQQCTSECCVRRCGAPGPLIGVQQAMSGATASGSADVLKFQYLSQASLAAGGGGGGGDKDKDKDKPAQAPASAKSASAPQSG